MKGITTALERVHCSGHAGALMGVSNQPRQPGIIYCEIIDKHITKNSRALDTMESKSSILSIVLGFAQHVP